MLFWFRIGLVLVAIVWFVSVCLLCLVVLDISALCLVLWFILGGLMIGDECGWFKTFSGLDSVLICCSELVLEDFLFCIILFLLVWSWVWLLWIWVLEF